MHFRPHLLLLIFFLISLTPVCAVAGEVSGGILYGAGQYRAEVDGKEAQEIKSQYGQVGLRYSSKGVLNDARVGKYSLMLGYEFNILSPTITNYGIRDPEAERIDTAKILYLGDILLAPGGLPFRLSAYSRDTHQTVFVEAGSRAASLPIGFQSAVANQSQTTLLSPDIVTEISNGTHHEVGATLLVGIRNGSYLGNYRDILSQLPRLLIDYRQLDVRDLSKDSNKEHYRERDLAFISLNKKDNWVHFRTHDYKDFLDGSQDFLTRQVMIGTVDQALARQWINLTSWIKISGDLSYTVEKTRNREFPANYYRANVFAIAQRQEFKTSVLPHFERLTEGENLTQNLELPVYFNYEPNRESYYRGSLRGGFVSNSIREGFTSTLNPEEHNRRDVTIDLASELFRTRATVFRPRINLGVSENDHSQGFNEKMTLEWSQRKERSSLPWTAGYYIASTQTSDDTNSSIYLEQSLYGNTEKDLNKSTRIGLSATVRRGSGQSENEVTEEVTDRVEIGSTRTGIRKEDVDSFLLYNGEIFLEHSVGSFLNRVELIGEGIKYAVDHITSMELRHELKIDRRTNRFSLKSTLTRGTAVFVESNDLEYVDRGGPQSSNLGWSSQATYNYDPDRRLQLTLIGQANGLSGDQGDATTWLVSEKLEYRFYASDGIIRKIAEISEEFGTEGSNKRLLERNRSTFLRVVAAAYPTKHLYAKVDSKLVVFAPNNSKQMTLNAETGVNFDKLQVALSYGRAYKEAEGFLAEVKEERWDVKVRKAF